MVIGLVSPYGDDETRIKTADKILEKWIEDTYDEVRAGVLKEDILFGKKHEDMQTYGKEISLHCYTFYTARQNNVYGGGRLEFRDSVNIDVWVMNNEDISGYDPRAVSLLKYLEEWVYVRWGDDHKGIYEVRLINSGLKPQPEMRNMTNPVVTVELTYIADKLDI